MEIFSEYVQVLDGTTAWRQRLIQSSGSSSSSMEEEDLCHFSEKQPTRPTTVTAGASAWAPHPSSGCSHALFKAEPIKGVLLALTVLAFFLRIAYKSVEFLTSLLSQCKQSCCHDLLLWDGASPCYQPNCGVLL